MNDEQQIRACLQDYFDGLFHADTQKLASVFHLDTVLKAPGIRRTRNEWLELVATRPVPAEVESSDAFRVLAIDLAGEQAMAKVECPLFEKTYIDFLGLLKENGVWKIVSKMYADKYTR